MYHEHDLVATPHKNCKIFHGDRQQRFLDHRKKISTYLESAKNCLGRIDRIEGLGRDLLQKQSTAIKMIENCDVHMLATYCEYRRIFMENGCPSCINFVSNKILFDRRFYKARIDELVEKIYQNQKKVQTMLRENISDVIAKRPLQHKTVIKIEL